MKELSFLIEKDSPSIVVEVTKYCEKTITMEVSNKADESVDIEVLIGYNENEDGYKEFTCFRYDSRTFEDSEFVDASEQLLATVGFSIDEKFADYPDEVSEVLDNLDQVLEDVMEEEEIDK